MSLIHLTNFRDFTSAQNSLVTSDASLNQLAAGIDNASILKGGTDASTAIADIHRLAATHPLFTITDHVSADVYYTQELKYRVEIDRDLRLIIIKGQEIKVTNTKNRTIYVYCVTLNGETDWRFDTVKPISPNCTILI